MGEGNPANRIVSDLSVLWGQGKHRLSLSINNLLNETYQDLANRAAQGRNIQFKYTIEEI
jgi:outer membrane receptor protein involved in Fe transport